MEETKNEIINLKARVLSRVLLALNVFIWLFLFTTFFLLEGMPDVVGKFAHIMAYLAYICIFVSVLIVVIFKTIPASKKKDLVIQYIALSTLNVLIALYHYGLSHMFEVRTFG